PAGQPAQPGVTQKPARRASHPVLISQGARASAKLRTITAICENFNALSESFMDLSHRACGGDSLAFAQLLRALQQPLDALLRTASVQIMEQRAEPRFIHLANAAHKESRAGVAAVPNRCPAPPAQLRPLD